MLTDNLPAVISFGVGLSAPLLVWAVTRPRPNTGRANAALCIEVFAAITPSTTAARFVVLPLVQRL